MSLLSPICLLLLIFECIFTLLLFPHVFHLYVLCLLRQINSWFIVVVLFSHSCTIHNYVQSKCLILVLICTIILIQIHLWLSLPQLVKLSLKETTWLYIAMQVAILHQTSPGLKKTVHQCYIKELHTALWT